MSTNPRVQSAVPDDAPSFGTALAHQPALLSAFGKLYGTLWTQGIVDQPLKELVRIRNARVTDCGY
jgi:hypothetical protein